MMRQPLVLVSGATRTRRPAHVGYFIEPKRWGVPESLPLEPGRWAMDNSAFGGGFDEGAYVRMLERFSGQRGCLFVTAPDVVGDAAATLARWPFWSRLLTGLGYPPAFVAQDGLDPDQVPWRELGALFIGGTTAFKESHQVRSLCAYARARGTWVHWGRVNGRRRYELAVLAGADSLDGSGFSRWPDTNIPLIADWQADVDQARLEPAQSELALELP